MQSLHVVCSLEQPKAVRQSLPRSPNRLRPGGRIFILTAFWALDSMNTRSKMSWTCHGLELFFISRLLGLSPGGCSFRGPSSYYQSCGSSPSHTTEVSRFTMALRRKRLRVIADERINAPLQPGAMRGDNRPKGDSLTAGQERSGKAAGLKKRIPSSSS